MPLRDRLPFHTEPLYLMDASAYVFRAFYANQNMSRADGFATNVLFYVFRLLLKFLREERPEYFAFILDGKGKNFRHRLYEPYKANRQATPEPLSAQIDPLCRGVKALGFFQIFSDDCEADDCIAALAHRYSAERPVVIIGADKDLRQCLKPDVYIWDPSAKDEKLLNRAGFELEYGFSPELWADYQALIGDSSDNIPGVAGIGPKGAGTLIKDFGTIEELQRRLPGVPPALRKKLEGHFEEALLYRRLTTLDTAACPTLTLEDMRMRPMRSAEAMALFDEYALRGLQRELTSMQRLAAPGPKTFTPSSQTRKTGSQHELMAKDEAATPGPLPETPHGAVDGKTPAPVPVAEENKNWAQGSLFGLAAATEKQGVSFTREELNALPSAESPHDLTGFLQGLPAEAKELLLVCPADLNPELATEQSFILAGNKTALRCPPDESGKLFSAALLDFLEKKRGSSFTLATPALKSAFAACPALRRGFAERSLFSLCLDLSLAGWLLSPEEYAYDWTRLSQRWSAETADLAANPAFSAEVALPEALGLILALGRIFAERLHGLALEPVLRNLEQPLVPVLLDMQERGICIDKTRFADFLQETEQELAGLTQKIHELAGMPFNIRSARQLGDVLFGLLKLPKGGKTQGGQASTSQEALEKLIGKHPIIDLILEYRVLEKLRSTYLDPLPRLADEQDRLHTTFNQNATATGRLSSSNPNLQNIPVRGAYGPRMRGCFKAGPGRLLVSADYSQIELRVLAHLSQDEAMLQAFRRNEDIHASTAALLYDRPVTDITPDQRRNAKTINFGLVYGMGAQKLGRELGISLAEAKAFMERYFEQLTGLKRYFERIEAEAKANGFVSTMTGRRRPCPEIFSNNQQLQSRARRQAINTCIQGTAADIIKLAMLAVAADPVLKELEAALVLQIHDELILETPKDKAEDAARRLSGLMSAVEPGGVRLSVPLAVDWGVGETWADAH